MSCSRYRHADDVGGQHVAGELDPPEGQSEYSGQCAGQQGLADARHVFDQQVTTGQQAGEGQLDLGLLAEDDLTDLAIDLLGQLLCLLQLIRICQCCDIPRHGQVPLGSDFSGR